MDAASYQLVVFGLAVALVSNLSRSWLWRSIVLLTASIVFLGLIARSPMVYLPLAGFLLLGYVGLILIERNWPRATMCSVLVTVFAYIWLKKYTFLPESLFLHSAYSALGLSYIFFRVLHLLIDTGDNQEKRHIGLGAYLLYMLNFTTFISGPIQRYDAFSRDQFADKPIALGPRVIGSQLERIVRGFFKVNVLAMLLHMVQDDAVAQLSQPMPMQIKMFAAIKLALVYPLFLYANFSGYIDIVIALARLMRVRLPENFDRPFAASSVLDFWNRWHMTLSNWLKTYVYNPLLVLLMRRISSLAWQPFLGVICFFVTFFLIGVWHGRTSEFIVFGVLTGGGMSINKLWQLWLGRLMGRKGYKALATNSVYVSCSRGLNFVWFGFTLFWFWAGWKQIGAIFSALSVVEWISVWLTAWLVATLVLALWEWLRVALLSIRTTEGPILTSRYALTVYASVMGLVAVVVTALLNQAAPEIVYKSF
ncbi:MAG: MBOAT family O-acyltransferase [Acidobacteriaceae bacterium]|nr:MBOAT family O-acyltransferase [Acidobacteriaceae bacterium]